MEGEVGAHSARILKHFAKYQVFKISIFLDISGPLRMSPAEAGHHHPPSWLRALWSSFTWCLHKYPGDSKLCYLIVRCYYQVVIAFASEKTWCLVYHKSYDSSIKDATYQREKFPSILCYLSSIQICSTWEIILKSPALLHTPKFFLRAFYEIGITGNSKPLWAQISHKSIKILLAPPQLTILTFGQKKRKKE